MRPEIEVVVAWGSRILGVRTIDGRGSFGLRELIGRLPVPSEALASVDGPLLRLRRSTVQLVVPRGVAGWIDRPGEARRSLDALQHVGTAFRSAPQRVFPEGSEVVLAPGSTVLLELGALGLRIACAAKGGRARRFRRAAVDRRLVASCGAAASILIGALGASAAAVPPLSPADEPPQPPRTHRFLIHADLEDLVARSSRAPELASEPPEALFAEAGEPCRCGHGGDTMGCPDALSKSGRYGVRGPQDNPDPHIASRRFNGSLDAYSFVISYNSPDPSSHESPTAPWGRDWSLGTDPISARGNMWGDEIGEANGPDELSHDDVVGGLSKALVPDGPARSRAERPPRVLHTGMSLRGVLAPSSVLPVVAARFGHFGQCYSAALARNPELRGRVDVRFRIEESGAVRSVRTSSAAVVDSGLLSCLAAAFEGLSFPPAEGSTDVTYPLLLRP